MYKLLYEMAMKFFNVSKESKGSKVGFPELINVSYTALMIFLVFTAGNDMLKGCIKDFHWEQLLYALLWISMVIQTTFAYKHIKEIPPKKYNTFALISDNIDICLFIYVCTAMSTMYDPITGKFTDLESYRHISIPFLILSINQFFWYINVREEKNKTLAAIFRLCLLFVVMLITTIWDLIGHNVGILAIIVLGNIVIMGLLRAINKAPTFFETIIDKWWKKLKKNSRIQKLIDKLSAPNKDGGTEEMKLSIEESSTTKQ